MPQINDSKIIALKRHGFSGALPQMLVDWAQSNGATSNQENTAIVEALQNKGVASSNQPNTAWREYLAFLGYSGSLPKQLLDFWTDGGLALLANDTFTDGDGTNLSAHTADSGAIWSTVAGQVNIVNNEADAIITPYHYYLDSFTVQPKYITVDVKDTLATTQEAGITIRDAGDGLNYINCVISAQSFATSVTIFEIVAGVSTVKASQVVFGDFRNNTDFFEFIITDTGGSIVLDATSVEATLITTWSAAPIATSSGVGLVNSTGLHTTTLYDNLIIRG